MPQGAEPMATITQTVFQSLQAAAAEVLCTERLCFTTEEAAPVRNPAHRSKEAPWLTAAGEGPHPQGGPSPAGRPVN